MNRKQMLALWFIEGERNEGIKGNIQEKGKEEEWRWWRREEGREMRGQESLVVSARTSSVSFSEYKNRAGVFRALPFVSCEVQSVLGQDIEEGVFLSVVSSPGPVNLLWFLWLNCPYAVGVFVKLSLGAQQQGQRALLHQLVGDEDNWHTWTYAAEAVAGHVM